MKLLLLTNEFPLPVNAGGVRRQLDLITSLGERHDVTLLARDRDGETPPALIEELRQRLGGDVETFPARAPVASRSPMARASRLTRAVVTRAPAWTVPAISTPLVERARELAHTHDCAVTFDDTAQSYCLLVPGIPFVLDKPNVLGASRRVTSGLRPGARLEHQLVCAWEGRVVRAAGAVVVTSDAEAGRLHSLYGVEPIAVPSGVADPTLVADPATAPQTIAWLGDHRYQHNRDGLLRFLTAWPALGARGAELLVVGRDPDPEVRARAAELDGVQLLGYVDDLDGLLAACRAAVAPVWAGAGIKMKTLALMGAGLPVAGTSVAFEGIAAVDGRNALVAETPDELAAALATVLDDAEQAAAMGARAHETIVADHTWAQISPRYESALARAVSR